jgi:hypothetical protein
MCHYLSGLNLSDGFIQRQHPYAAFEDIRLINTAIGHIDTRQPATAGMVSTSINI